MAAVTLAGILDLYVAHERLLELPALPRWRVRLRPAVLIGLIRPVKMLPQSRRRGVEPASRLPAAADGRYADPRGNLHTALVATRGDTGAGMQTREALVGSRTRSPSETGLEPASKRRAASTHRDHRGAPCSHSGRARRTRPERL